MKTDEEQAARLLTKILLLDIMDADLRDMKRDLASKGIHARPDGIVVMTDAAKGKLVG